MDNIVEFKRSDPPGQDLKSRLAGGACEIILFPGVRYERWDTAPPPVQEAATANSRKRRHKKRISELAD